MHASTQEIFKHTIPPQAALDLFHPQFPPPPHLSFSSTTTASNSAPRAQASDQGDDTEAAFDPDPSNCRINITFRFYRPDYRPSSIPHCRCDVPTILRPDMKGRPEKGKEQERMMKYWWTCYAGAQNDGKGCGFWKVMDVQAEGRGPFVDPLQVRAYSADLGCTPSL